MSWTCSRRRAFPVFIAIAAAGYLVYLLSPSWPWVFVGLALATGWSGMASPATFAVIADALPRDRRAMGFTVQSILRRVPRLVSPLVGGALFLLITGLAVAGISVVGSLIVRREPRNLVGWVLLGSSLGLAAQSAAFDYISLSQDRFSLGLPATVPVAWIDNWLMIPSLFGLVILVPLLFPTGRLPSPRWRPVGVLALIGITVTTVGSALAPGPLQVGGIDNPLSLRLPHPIVDIAGGIDVVSGLALFGLTAAAVVVRYRHGTPLERLQLRWFAYPATLGIVGIGASNIVTTGLSDAAWIGGLLAIAVTPFAIGIAILRHRLFDIDLVIKRTISYGVLTVLLVGLEIGGVLVLQNVLSTITREQTYAVAATTLGVAALFWAVLQPWWGFPFDALGATVSLEGSLDAVDAPVWALCLWMIVLGTILPFVLSLGALHHLPATRVATVSMIEVLLAALVAWIWLGETLSAAQLLGGAVVLVGVVLAQTSR